MPQRRGNRVSKCSKDSLLELSANAAPQSGPTAVDDTAAKPQPALKPEPAQTLYKFPLPKKPRAGVLPRSASMRGIYSCASSGRVRRRAWYLKHYDLVLVVGALFLLGCSVLLFTALTHASKARLPRVAPRSIRASRAPASSPFTSDRWTSRRAFATPAQTHFVPSSESDTAQGRGPRTHPPPMTADGHDRNHL
ncbi:uncharacterized protein LOC144094695 [Amblyomma americanum]